jgi:predicted nucleotidyltransferase
MQNDSERYDPNPALVVLADAGVDFVLIGGLAGQAHGSALLTFDLDIAYERSEENLERLAAVLRAMGAQLRGAPEGLPFQLDARALAAGANFTFATGYGSVDILSDPAGAPPYPRLREDAVAIEVEGRRVLVASLDHLIAMKTATGRAKDTNAAMEYRVLADEIRRREADAR